ASFAGLISWCLVEPGQPGSVVGSLVIALPARARLSVQQFRCPSSSHQKSTPLGARLPVGVTPMTLASIRLPFEVSVCASYAGPEFFDWPVGSVPRNDDGTQNCMTPARQLS